MPKGYFSIILLWLLIACEKDNQVIRSTEVYALNYVVSDVEDTLTILNKTFLGNAQRNYYGSLAPDSLHLIWELYLGKGETVVNPKNGRITWRGAGWTGQPLMVKEKEKEYIIQGAFDYRLKKIDASNGSLIWEYHFDNVIKGTGTLWFQELDSPANSQLLILQGARKNIEKNLSSDHIYSFRAISYSTGKEVWRLPVKKGPAYSRDVDASAVMINKKGYIPTENGYLTIFDPYEIHQLEVGDSIFNTPKIIKEIPLFETNDKVSHGANLVPEASPVRNGIWLYISSGSGHVYGINTQTDTVEWRYTIGADLNGTPVVASDSALLIPIEKQYIKGMGGVIKVNPFREDSENVDWFFPTENKGYADWQGGVIGSVTLHQNKKEWCAFHGLDGFLYVLDVNNITKNKVLGPQAINKYPTPRVIYKHPVGPSISTPLFVDNNTLISATYNGIYLFKFDEENEKFILNDFVKGGFEATPFVNNYRVYVASRDGNLYCYGDRVETTVISEEPVILIAETKAIEPVVEYGTVDDIDEKQKEDQIIETQHQEKFAPKETKGKYYLIAGAFKELSNAEAFTLELKQKGFDNAMLLTKQKELNYVSVNQYQNMGEAQAALNTIGVSTWIYADK